MPFATQPCAPESFLHWFTWAVGCGCLVCFAVCVVYAVASDYVRKGQR
jgi:formate/nitrite transporter FocA (FNT family)